MKVFVTVELFHGIIENVECYTSLEDVEERENKWLEDNNIKSKNERLNKADLNGVEFRVFENKIKEKI